MSSRLEKLFDTIDAEFSEILERYQNEGMVYAAQYGQGDHHGSFWSRMLNAYRARRIVATYDEALLKGIVFEDNTPELRAVADSISSPVNGFLEKLDRFFGEQLRYATDNGLNEVTDGERNALVNEFEIVGVGREVVDSILKVDEREFVYLAISLLLGASTEG